ncbi:MAG: hypothetical protein EOM20_08590 [Spartobacteria bacterium]|nr:hypothetical protein [Spartobacteria bacterium]
MKYTTLDEWRPSVRTCPGSVAGSGPAFLFLALCAVAGNMALNAPVLASDGNKGHMLDLAMEGGNRAAMPKLEAYTLNPSGQIGWVEYGPDIWTNMGAGINSVVEGLWHDGDYLYVGGWFTNAGGTGANYIAQWDGHAWSALGDGVDAWVYAVAGCESNLYAGGLFTHAGGAPAQAVAKWNGASWTNLGSGIIHHIRAMLYDGTQLVVAGSITNAGGGAVTNVATWNGSAWSPLGGGLNSDAMALAHDGANLYAGGYFTRAGNMAANRVARWDGVSWTNLGSGMSDSVSVLLCEDADVYAGGFFATAGGMTVNRIAKWDGGFWTNLGSGLSGVGSVMSLAHDGTCLYAGGQFTNIGGVTASHIAKWDGAAWTNLGSGMSGHIKALAHDGVYLYAGGIFTNAGGVTTRGVARWGPSYVLGDSGVAPGQGSWTGGYTVVISGSNLCNGSDLAYVTLCDVSAEILSQSPTQVVVVAGAAASASRGAVRVASTNNGMTEKVKAFEYTREPQTALTFLPPSPLAFGTTNALSATGGSGVGALGFTVLSGPGTMVDSANLAVMSGGGTIVIRAAKAWDHQYFEAAVTATVEAAKAEQIIIFPAIDDQLTTNEVGLAASASSGLEVTFSILDGPGSLDGTNLTFTGAGLVTMVAEQVGNADWNPAPRATNMCNVTKAVAEVYLENLEQIYDGTARSVSATTLPVGLVVEFTYDGDASAPTNAESYAVTGTVNDAIFQGTSEGVLIVDRGEQVISGLWPTNGSAFLATAQPSVLATASSGLNVSFEVLEGPGALDGSRLTFTNAGDVYLVASQSGDTNWRTAPSVTNLLRVFVVSPSHGPAAGHHAVTIYHGDMGAITNVRIGGVDTVIEAFDAGWVRVAVTAWEKVGVQDILIASGTHGQTLLRRGYTVNPPGVIRQFQYGPNVWTNLGDGVGGQVRALAHDGRRLYVGGYFTNVGNKAIRDLAMWDPEVSAWTNLGHEVVSGVTALTHDGERLYAGGGFAITSSSPALCAAAWNGAVWTNLGKGIIGGGQWIEALSSDGSSVYAGGYFTNISEVGAHHLARWDEESGAWSALGVGMNSAVRTLLNHEDTLYAGGNFTQAGDVPANYIAQWDASAWNALHPGMNAVVYALAHDGSNLYAGGNFEWVGGLYARRVAMWNGVAWTNLGLGLNTTVNALAYDGSTLYAGGNFTTTGGNAARYIAKWNPVQGAWTNLGSGMNSSVSALAHDGTYLYAGGTFTNAGGIAACRVARWGPASVQETSGIEPESGVRTGGYPIVISGVYLGDGADITNVTLCGVNATITSQSATQVVVEAGVAFAPGVGDVRVLSTSHGETVKSNAFEYTPVLFEVTVRSAYGTTLPPTGVHAVAEGSVMTNQVQTPDTRATTQYIAQGWVAAGNLEPAGGAGTQAVVTVHGDGLLTWQWTTNYWLESVAGEHGNVEGGNDWVACGIVTQLLAVANPYCYFTNWTGDASGQDNPLELLMDASKSVTAIFAAIMTSNQPTPLWWLAEHDITNNVEDAVITDHDGDGIPTWAEWIMNTDPMDSNSCLRMAGFVPSEEGWTLAWMADTGRVYDVEHATNFLWGGWAPLQDATNLVPEGGWITLTNTFGEHPETLYRLKVRLP